MPKEWDHQFDFVFEAYTIQALPTSVRTEAIAAVAKCVVPQGRLLVVCSGADANPNGEGPPWPLTRAEVKSFSNYGLKEVSFETITDPTHPIDSIFIAVFR